VDEHNPFVVRRSRRERDRRSQARPRPTVSRWLRAFVPAAVVFAIWWLMRGTSAFFAFGFPPGPFVFFVCCWLVVMVAATARRPAGALGDPTGTIVRPPPPPPDGSAWRGPMPPVVGGINAPAAFRRANLSFPFGWMALAGSTLTLGVRPRLLGLLFGVRGVDLTPTEVDRVYPVGRTRFGSGIAVAPRDGETWYVWTWRREFFLAYLAAAGFPVQWEERRS
jgi:hypothetical protein